MCVEERWISPRVLTGFQENDLIVLRQLHETGYHLSEFDYLLYDRRQFLRTFQPQFFVSLKRGTRTFHAGWGRRRTVPFREWTTHHILVVDQLRQVLGFVKHFVDVF